MTSSHVGRIRRLRSPEKQSPKGNAFQNDNAQQSDELVVSSELDEGRAESLQGTGVYEIERMRRFVAVTVSDDEVTTHVLLELSCLLIEGTIIVITAMGDETENGIEAEAEISLEELLALKNSSDAGIANDLPQLRKLVNELLDSIDVRIEEGVARLVLSLSPDAQSESPPTDPITRNGGPPLNSSDKIISEDNEYADEDFD